ncbi:DUF6392 family protein [Pseudomonas phoenicis]|uniref:DUF6392 family protein n=1 Tax=unclassified Pseudomonas TaxID=196821 RepID=UPI0039A2EFB9
MHVLEHWLQHLGKTHSELIQQGVLPDRPREILFDGFDAETCFPLPGVELEFSTDAARLTCIHANVISTFDGEPAYGGPLPAPLQQVRTRQAAIDLLGAPLRSQSPFRLPKPIGRTGGWDTFSFDETYDPPTSVMFLYTPELNVSCLSFFLGRLQAEPDPGNTGLHGHD